MAEKQPPREVNISCRAKMLGRPGFDCEGRKAQVLNIRNIRGGGRAIQYRCLSCGQFFVLST